MISNKDAIKFYNSVGAIFRSFTDPTDNQARMLVNKYQNDSIVSDAEESLIKSYLNSEVNQIKVPYTINLTDCFIRIYLINKKDLVCHLKNGIDINNIRRVFSDYKNGYIMVIDKDIFTMQDIYDKYEDKKQIFNLYRSIFNHSIMDGSAAIDTNLLSDMLSALFIYQVSGGNLSKEDFNKLVPGNHSDIYDTIEKIYNRVGVDIPYITEGSEIANMINETLSWTWYNK